MTTNNSAEQSTSHTDAPPFPHHAATPQSPLEAAERQYAERPSGTPNWQPDEGDFT